MKNPEKMLFIWFGIVFVFIIGITMFFGFIINKVVNSVNDKLLKNIIQNVWEGNGTGNK